MKKYLSMMLIITFLLIPLELHTQAAGSKYPTWKKPVENEEITSFQNYTVSWYAPTSGTVSHYLFSLRKLKEKNDSTKEEAIYQNVNVNSNRTFTIPSNKITPASYYRIAVGAVMTDGTSYWITRNIFSSASRGVQSGNVISFKFSPYMTYDEKITTYQSAQTWRNAIGIEVANTYPTTTVPTAEYPHTSDGENIVTPYFGGAGDIMTTYIRRNSTTGYIVEADIAINTYYNITIGPTSTSFDFQHVMTHEFGHVIGLSDKYESFSTQWTMYGLDSYNITNKRTLETHDIQYARVLSGVA